jgi:flagellar M-ring protein FliF
MDKVLQQAREFWNGLTARQRTMMIGGAAVAIVALLVFVFVLSKPEYKILYSGLGQEESQTIAKRLAEKGVSYEVTPDGATLKVAPDDIDKARLDLASQGLPRSGRLGFEIFDKPNWAGSDFAEKVNYQRALEGELERTIQTIQAVEAVRVHLVMPRESLFTERERDAKAAVVLKLHGTRLEEDSVRAITYLVASAVDTLKPENVTIVSADGRALSQAGRTVSVEQAKLEALLAARLEATLAPVIGEAHMHATVNVEFDSSSTETQQETYDPLKAVVLTTQQSEDRQGAGAGAGGVPGTASNVPQATPASATPVVAVAPGAPLTKTTEEGQYQKTQSETYAVSKSVRHNVQPAGSIKRISTAILIDDAVEYTQENGKNIEKRRKRTPEEITQLETLAKGAVGYDTTRGDAFVLQSITFQIVPMEPMTTPGFKEKVDNIANEWKNPLRYGGLVLMILTVYLLVIRPMQRKVSAEAESEPARIASSEAGEPAVALSGAPSAATAALAAANLIRDDESFLEGELHNELSATSSDVKRAVILKRHLVERVKNEPVVASKLIQNWIRAKGDRH